MSRSRCLILLASERDEQARAFATRYAKDGLRVLVPADLSRPGWCWRSVDPLGSVALINAERLSSRDIDGVITRLPWVLECDLPGIRAGEQEYAAAEINAFLLAWLVSLRCPLLNRPSAQCLSGPGWRAQMWVRKAFELGIPACSVRQTISAATRSAIAEAEPDEAVAVTVVGDTVVGTAGAVLKRHAVRLAAAAGVQLLCVRFSSPARDAFLLGASLWPDLSDPKIGEAVWNHFREPATRGRAAASA
jgi:hypothetical protein